MNSYLYVAKILSLSVTLAASTSAPAGTLGAVSRSSISISVTIPIRLETKILQNPAIHSGLGGSRKSQIFCVVTGTPGLTYSITLARTAGTSAPEIGQESNDAVSVSVDWTDQREEFHRTLLRPDKSVGGLLPAGTPDCLSAVATGATKVTIRTDDRPELLPNASSMPVTLLIAPE